MNKKKALRRMWLVDPSADEAVLVEAPKRVCGQVENPAAFRDVDTIKTYFHTRGMHFRVRPWIQALIFREANTVR